MRGFIDEMKAAVAGLARAPAFTALAVGVLGLGLGAVIFMYGVADTLMLKPAPYPNGDRLYTIVTLDGAGSRTTTTTTMLPQDYAADPRSADAVRGASAAPTSAPPT